MRIVALRFAVERLEAVRDRLNPDVALSRRVDANLEELKAWRKQSSALRGHK